MKKKVFYLLVLLLTIGRGLSFGQSNNPISIYEGEQINSVQFTYTGLPVDSMAALNLRSQVQGRFRAYPQTQFSAFMADYYVAQITLLPTVEQASYQIQVATQGGLDLTVLVAFSSAVQQATERQNIFKNPASFPVLYNDHRTFMTLKFSASQMAYSNNNAWFAQPTPMTNGNPLVNAPSGVGYSAWLEGFANAGLYGITKIVPRINLNVYGGVSYLASFSAGNELFTKDARVYGAVEEAFVGFVGAGRTAGGHTYRYNTLYGRKQFVLGDGWLIVNTSMNGYNRAALQLNPRWASRHVFQSGFAWDRLFIQGFRLQANELDILNSATTLNGVNVELGRKERLLLGATLLTIPHSRFKYYLPDGTIHSRAGLQVYNLRLYRSAPAGRGGLFFKSEGGYQRNLNFDMSAWAYYAELGWSFSRTSGSPSISYRYAYFSGDNPSRSSYNRWDALYTGGTGEQWVQGSNMYKMVQNSNERTHRLQAVYSPLRKIQLVGQVWLFYAPSLLNLGGNPALSMLQSPFYGTEYNLTVKYFHSREWYFHLNTAYTLPGEAITRNVPHSRNWFCLSVFARYSF